jgi:general secretion pathway protein J
LRDDESGFTLIEALIAMTLLGLLGVLIMGALRFGVMAWQRSDDVADRLDELIHVESFMRQTIALASPTFISRPPDKGYVAFEGREHLLRLVADPPASLDQGGRLILTFLMLSERGHADLFIESRPELAAEGTAVTRRMLLEDVPDAKFSYYGAKEPGGEAGWHSEWIEEPAFPQLIRLDLAQRADPVLSPIIIRLLIDTDVSCVYDRLTGRCRGR